MEKEKNYLIFIVSEENIDIIKEKRIIGFQKRFLKSLRKFIIGDEIIIYIKGKELLGVFKLDSVLFEGEKSIFSNEVYPLRFKLKEKREIKRKPFLNKLIPKLDFITNKEHWMGNFQGKSFIFISKKDFKLLEGYLNEK